MRKALSIINVAVDAATKGNTNQAMIDNGNVVGLVVYSSSPSDNHNNPGMVRVEVLVNSNPVVYLQPVDNLRSRNVPLLQDGIPFTGFGGQTIEIKILATENFNADTQFDAVFIYDNEQC